MIPKFWSLAGKTITQNGRLYTISPLNPSEFSDSFYYLLTTNNLGISGIDNVLIAVVDTSYSDPNSVRFIANDDRLAPVNIKYLFRLEDTIIKGSNINSSTISGYVSKFDGNNLNNYITSVPNPSGFTVYTLNQSWGILQEGYAISPGTDYQLVITDRLVEFVEIDLFVSSWTNNYIRLINSDANTVLLTLNIYPSVSKYFIPIAYYKKDLVRAFSSEPTFIISFATIDIDFIRYVFWGGKAHGGFTT